MRKRRNMIRTGRKAAFGRRAGTSGKAATAFAALQFTVACSRAPSFNILGSFFPSWILCGVLGILLTVAARLLFVRLGLEEQISPLILVYPCLAAFFTFTLWLVCFS